MDRDLFSNTRRARHFGRSNQVQNTFPHRNNGSGFDQNRRNLRDIYRNENHHEVNRFGAFPGSPVYVIDPRSFSHERSRRASSDDFLSDPNSDLAFHLASLGLDENGNRISRSPSSNYDDIPKYMRTNRLSTLPSWALDENREIRSDLTLQKVVDEGLVLLFAMDKSGCHFLQSNYYGENTQDIHPLLRQRITEEVLGNREVFLNICKNIFGNFFLQRVIEYSDPIEQEIIKRYIISDITALCLDKSACRVVQTALEKLDTRYADAIVGSLPRKNHLRAICTDQNANHVIQKVIKKMSLSKWDFLITYLCKTEHNNLLDVCQDKYGCRVVQTIVEVLSCEGGFKMEAEEKFKALKKLMQKIVEKCQKLASNEFANYVIQHIIASDRLCEYKNIIIEKCLLRNLLSMSQEKYASHVVERAFCYAPLHLVTEMMEEIFDGYIPHPDTGKDALDILIFHQFGNYVVQRMLTICVNVVFEAKDTIIDRSEIRDKFESWLIKLCIKARKESQRLSRFSSGKKILEILDSVETKINCHPSYTPQFTNELFSNLFQSNHLFSQANTATSLDWNSRKSSFSSDNHHEPHDFHDQHDFNYGRYHPKF